MTATETQAVARGWINLNFMVDGSREALSLSSKSEPDASTLIAEHYPGWMLLEGDSYCGLGARAEVAGDFNGDRILDHAVRIVRGDRGQIVAFLSSSRTFSRVVLEEGSRAEIMNSALGVERRGTRHSVTFNLDHGWQWITLADDAPTGGTCEASSFIYLISGRTVTRAFTSD